VQKPAGKVEIERIRSGRVFSRADFIKRLKRQMPLGEKLKHADFVVDNRATLARRINRFKKFWIL